MTQISPIDKHSQITVPPSARTVTQSLPIPQQGFTLIELLLATSIGSMVLAAVYMTFTTALDSQRRIERVSVQTQESRFFYERLRHDVKNMVLAEDFRGEAAAIGFTVVHAGAGTRNVSYQVRPYKGVAQLVRNSVSSVQEGNADASPTPDEVVVFEQLETVSFRYLGDNGWQTQTDESTLPRAIECKLISKAKELIFTVNIELDDAPAAS